MTVSLTDDERERLAGRARTLQERIDRPVETSTDAPGDGTEWVDEWRNRVADGDADDFCTRLAYDDLDAETCKRYLDTHGWPQGAPVPEWVDDLEAVLRFAADVDADPSRVAAGTDEESVPFEEVISVFLEYARRQVDPSLVPDGGLEPFEGWLVKRFESLLAQTLFIEFKTYLARQRDQSSGDDWSGSDAHGDDRSSGDAPDESRERYEEFTRALLDAGLKPFFLEYSYLARLLVTTVAQWVDAVEEFWSRLADDRDELRDEFCDRAALGDVTDLEVLGDRHHDGRAVVGVTFESGTKVTYKPRALDVEDAFYDLLEWINEQSALPDLATVDCLVRDGYGWTEWVSYEECRTEEEVARYYRRAGVLVCLLHALNFTDGHYENIVAAGERPVLVDVETIAQPVLPPERTLSSEALTDIMARSVMRTSLLPSKVSDEDFWETSGFGEADVTFSSVTMPTFSNVNTDAMELEFEDTYSVSGDNLPRIDGDVRPPSDHVDEIERGFERMHGFLRDARDDLLAADGPLKSFEGVEIRYLHRSTNTYGSVLKSLREPKYLRTGLKFGCKIEALAKPFCSDSVEPELWPIYERERTALTRSDVPRFSMRTSDTDLRFDGQSVVELAAVPPMQQVRDRIRDLDRTDLDEQLAYLRLAFSDDGGDHATIGGRNREPVPGDGALSAGAFERASRQVADRIAGAAARNRDGECTWYLRDRLDDGGIYLRQVDSDLYAGRLGIGLFFAASSSVLGDERDRELAADAVAPVRERLRNGEEEPFADLPVGGGSGLGSLVYGFTRMGTILGDDQYLEDARRATELLTAERIRGDETYDVVGGTAGAALGLLALYDATDDRDVRKRAVTCGEHLLSNRTRTANGTRVWHTVESGQPLTGLAHGVSGIAYALVRLADETGAERFENAALEALEFERNQYSPEEGNWPDLRSYSGHRFNDAWCHGRSGIGLARAGTYDVTASEWIREDLERAVDGLDPETLVEYDHVCCGIFGQVAFALEAGNVLGDETYVEHARRLATASVRRAETNGRFTVDLQTDHWQNPTFFRGESGIGYGLLRLRSPELPCVLRWE